MRSLAVSLIASKVHSASRTPAEYLYDVPSSAYCNEVDDVRLILITLAFCTSTITYGTRMALYKHQIWGSRYKDL